MAAFADTPYKRFIPASAGNGIICTEQKHELPVHPRERGERCTDPPMPVVGIGSSPRARGTGSR